MKRFRFKNRGLTILELMITLAVAGILIASSAPSFTASIQNTRMVTQINELQAALSLGRSEAIKRNETVSICRNDVGEDSGMSCGDDWKDGWIVFVDVNADGAVDNDADCDDATKDCVLRVHGTLSGSNTLEFSQTNVIYGTDGIALSGVQGFFTLCDSRGDDHVKGLVIGVSGRPRVAVEADSDSLEGCSS